jgi:hypothetical protein
MKIVVAFLLLCLSACTSHQVNKSPEPNQPQVVASANEAEPLNVDLCELLQSPQKYEQKLIRIKAIYCYCFEDSNLSSTNCSVQKSVWVQGSLDKCKNAGRVDDFQSPAKDEPASPRWGAHTVGIVAIGKLIGTRGGYGQMNGYDYLFEIRCLERAELFDVHGKKPAAMTKEQQHKVEVFETSN